jgi:hypothetical protein
MKIPKSLQILFVALVIAFLVSVISTKRAKFLSLQYEKIGEISINGGRVRGGGGIIPGPFPVMEGTNLITSYQDSAAVYALASGKKDVTYCVIDGRLVDNKTSS